MNDDSCDRKYCQFDARIGVRRKMKMKVGHTAEQ